MKAIVVVQVMESERSPGGPFIVDLDSLDRTDTLRAAIETAMQDTTNKMAEHPFDDSLCDSDARPRTLLDPPCAIADMVTIYTD
jgi:hypothetical protein